MTAFLPPGIRCSAYWYAWRAGLLTSGDLFTGGEYSADLEFLRTLGWFAARRARWLGIPDMTVPEGPYRVHMWPERVWSDTADAMAQAAAEHGDYDDVPWTLEVASPAQLAWAEASLSARWSEKGY